MKSIISVALLTLIFATAAFAELPSASPTVITQALASGQPTIIDLGARSCIPCKRMAPILEALSTEYQGKASVLFVDVYEDKVTTKKFAIKMIPTQIFFDNKGKEVKRHVGEMTRDEIIKELKAAGLK